jgi:hypothetical protein
VYAGSDLNAEHRWRRIAGPAPDRHESADAVAPFLIEIIAVGRTLNLPLVSSVVNDAVLVMTSPSGFLI